MIGRHRARGRCTSRCAAPTARTAGQGRAGVERRDQRTVREELDQLLGRGRVRLARV